MCRCAVVGAGGEDGEDLVGSVGGCGFTVGCVPTYLLLVGVVSVLPASIFFFSDGCLLGWAMEYLWVE